MKRGLHQTSEGLDVGYTYTPAYEEHDPEGRTTSGQRVEACIEIRGVWAGGAKLPENCICADWLEDVEDAIKGLEGID